MKEIKRFSDFYQHIITSPKQLKCPECRGAVTLQVFTGFNMDISGRADIVCQTQKCPLYKSPITIEAIGGWGT